jgi:hypothetical protein
MKKKLTNLMLLILVVSIGLLSYRTNNFDIKKATADSGFDSGWDSGGSSGGSSWDSGSSWYHDSSSGGGDSSVSEEEVLLILMIFITFLICSFIYVHFFEKTIGESSINRPKKKDYVDEKLKEYGIDEVKMVDVAYSTYLDIQKAWMDNDINKVKDKLSDELYNTYKMQLLTLKRKNQQNVMSDFNFVDGYIYDIDDSNDKLSLSVFLNVKCKDYLIDIETGRVLRGSKSKIWNYEYTIDYLITKKAEDVLKKCPNCGAGLNEESGSRIICPYCRTLLVRTSPNLVMTRKHMNNQS